MGTMLTYQQLLIKIDESHLLTALPAEQLLDLKTTLKSASPGLFKAIAALINYEDQKFSKTQEKYEKQRNEATEKLLAAIYKAKHPGYKPTEKELNSNIADQKLLKNLKEKLN